jgi:transposase InsO family protein
MTRGSVREYAAAMRGRYRKAGKKQKGVLLAEFCAVSGYHRKAAIRLLNQRDGGRARGGRTGRPKVYGAAVTEALARLWEAAGGLSGKLLVPFLAELVEQLERHGELRLAPKVRAQVLTVSPATADRLLAPSRASRPPRQPWTHRAAASGLRAHIPLRTFGEWVEAVPGELQADLVSHCGSSTEGFYLTTLVTVDVAVGWTELEAVWGKGEERVGAALARIDRRLPVPTLSLHTDNGGEFLSRPLWRWTQQRGIARSRGRPYRKNDQAWAEQRNWTAVRRTVVYDRYSSKQALATLERLYRLLNDYLNFFQPMRKVIAKERHGARVHRRFDDARTPYRRVLETGALSPAAAARLADRYDALNPIELRRQIDDTLAHLSRLADHAYAR